MHLSVPVLATAPFTTGHPLALPKVPQRLAPSERITAPVQSDTTGFSPRSPLDFWRSMNGEPDPETHVPPPSIMQIKIETLLGEQQEDTTAPEPDAQKFRALPPASPFADISAASITATV